MIITDEEKRTTAYPRGRARAVARHAAERRPGPQGDDHPARHGARRDACSCPRTTSTTTRASTSHDQIAILMGGRIAEELIARQHDDRRRQRHRARDRARAQDGLRVGHERRARAAHLRQEGGADLPRPRDRAAPRLLRGHGDPDRPRGQADRHGTTTTRARNVLNEHREKLDRVAEELLDREVLDADQVGRIVNGEALDEHKTRPTPATPTAPASDDSGRRPQRERPAIVPTITKPVTQE